MTLVAAAIAGVVHVLFFVLESFLFTGPAGRKVFNTTPEQAETMKFLAFNQGFYNLFLALGAFAGVALSATGRAAEGRAVITFACACMLGAAAVLASGGARYARGVIAQGVPPLLALVGIVIGS